MNRRPPKNLSWEEFEEYRKQINIKSSAIAKELDENGQHELFGIMFHLDERRDSYCAPYDLCQIVGKDEEWGKLEIAEPVFAKPYKVNEKPIVNEELIEKVHAMWDAENKERK